MCAPMSFSLHNEAERLQRKRTMPCRRRVSHASRSFAPVVSHFLRVSLSAQPSLRLLHRCPGIRNRSPSLLLSHLPISVSVQHAGPGRRDAQRRVMLMAVMSVGQVVYRHPIRATVTALETIRETRPGRWAAHDATRRRYQYAGMRVAERAIGLTGVIGLRSLAAESPPGAGKA